MSSSRAARDRVCYVCMHACVRVCACVCDAAARRAVCSATDMCQIPVDIARDVLGADFGASVKDWLHNINDRVGLLDVELLSYTDKTGSTTVALDDAVKRVAVHRAMPVVFRHISGPRPVIGANLLSKAQLGIRLASPPRLIDTSKLPKSM